ncbi:E3 UFM1-protein ligase 1 [Phytophthora infestans]|uniref:E3 UFM1-protein ligase 1 n=1 Tax=Phytophthora infestans TaxID=4787 RepID=A0A8S9V2P4_PHYIN|nr:E3 UFM1-protein ligase 1 [Phytophthora infestans]KAF4145764.1 E3 UFM1-protein ligase 1 [Phytophthora infestans]
MDEIALLQQQLAAVQQQEAALKLSDHNVIDLLLKLQQLGKLQVIHTRTGKQFLTPLQIQREIADYVALHGGRLSLTELEKLIDVDRTHVEKQATALCRGSRSKDSYHLVNNGEELLTSWYLDGIMEDTDVLLQESGTTSIGDLAQQFGFAVDYMRDVVRTRLGSILKARERDNVLYTDSYVTAQKARLRGVFAAVTRPVFVPDVLRSFSFDEAVANEALTELIQSKVLMGTLRGREYVPYVFMAAQRESVYSFFQQNGYLEHARAKELQVARPYDFLKKRFPDAVPLQESVVIRALQLQLEGAVEAAVNDNSFVDVRSLLPSALPAGDVGLLLGMSPALEKAGHVSKAFQIADNYAVSSGFFASCWEKFGEDATTKASRAAAQQKTCAVQTSARESRQEVEEGDDSDDEDASSKRGKKGKRSKGGNKRDPEESGGRSGKSGKGKKGKRGPKHGGDAGDDKSRSVSTQFLIVPSREETTALLVKWFPAVEDIEGDDEFMDGMVLHLEPKINELYSAALAKALSSIIRGDAASLRELRKVFEDRFDEQLTKLLVLEKGFNKLSMQVDAKDPADMEQLAFVEKHVLDSSAVELAALVTSFMAESNSLDLEGVPHLSSVNTDEEKDKRTAASVTSLSDENKKVLESALPQSTASALVRLWTLATAGRWSLSDFTAHVPVLAEALSMPLRKLDRKKERQVIFSYRQATLAELEENATLATESYQHCALVATLILQLFFQQTTSLPGSFPRDTVSYGGMVVKAFKDSVPDKAISIIQTLVDTADAITSNEDGVEDLKNTWSERLDTARELVLLKDLNSVQ